MAHLVDALRTSRAVAGSIPDGPEVDLVSKRNAYQEYEGRTESHEQQFFVK